MTALSPDYNVNTWKLGYQTRQMGLAGPSVVAALATPPANMVTAANKAIQNPPTFVTAPAPVAGTSGAEKLPY